MKLANVIIVILLIVAAVLGISYAKQYLGDADKSGDSKPEAISDLGSPAEIVNIYLYTTLGTLPDAVVNTDIAKEYLGDDLAAQIEDPMFIPTSYGIQQGPDTVKVTTENVTGKTAMVIVEGIYGGAPAKEWTFTLKHDGAQWIITSIDNADIY